jgi:hypothetical protein
MRPDVILGIITVTMAVVGGIVSAHAPTNLVYKIGYIAAFLVLGGGALVFVITQSRDSAKSEIDLKHKIDELAASSAEAARLQAQNNELQARIFDLAKSNASLAKESIATVTGGDSYSYMDFIYQLGAPPRPIFIHCGKYPLYNVSIRVVDLNALRTRVELHQPLDAVLGITLNIDELQVGTGWFSSGFTIPFSDDRAQDFNVFFSARNGTWTEELRLRKVDNNWVKALRVWLAPIGLSKPSAKPVFEEVAKEFPRNLDGQVDWGK